MEKMKMRFTNAVSSKLSSAPNSTAKAELIEELSDNLFRRYLDMTAAGMNENQAFEAALDDLGNVDELLDYLKELSPEEELPRLTLHPYEEQEKAQDEMDALLDNVDKMVRGALNQAEDALKQAREALRQAGQANRRGGSGAFDFRADEENDGQAAPSNRETRSKEKPSQNKDQKWELSTEFDTGKGRFFAGTGPKGADAVYGFGYDKAKGGFFTQRSEWRGGSSNDRTIPSQNLRGVDIQTVNGDVTIHLIDDENADVLLDGDVNDLEVKVTDNGVLAIRQGRTASSSFFFLRGLSSADVKLYLPRRRWEFIQVSAVNGDVCVNDGIELDRLSVKTTSGDLECNCAACGRLYFESSSGDLLARGLTGDAQVKTIGGDIRLNGHMGEVQIASAGGDMELDGSFQTAHCASTGGDIRFESAVLPEVMELSTSFGDCEARIPDTAAFVLRYKTTSGEFYSDFPMIRTSDGAIYLDGGDRTYSMATIGGDLELKKY